MSFMVLFQPHDAAERLPQCTVALRDDRGVHACSRCRCAITYDVTRLLASCLADSSGAAGAPAGGSARLKFACPEPRAMPP